VVPRNTSEEDLSRLKSLCSIHGVGLVTFSLDKATPDYGVVVLPAQAAPDMFYPNQMLKRLLEAAPEFSTNCSEAEHIAINRAIARSFERIEDGHACQPSTLPALINNRSAPTR